MSEVSTSRRAVMRALAVFPSIIATPAAAETVGEPASMPTADALPPAVIDALIKSLRAAHVQMFVHNGELHTAFPEPGVTGRPEREDFLDHIDGAQRALYRLMCAIPGAIDAVRSSIEGEGRA